MDKRNGKKGRKRGRIGRKMGMERQKVLEEEDRENREGVGR